MQRQLSNEFLGLNVAISSGDESHEVLLDLDAHVSAELFGEIQEAGLQGLTFVRGLGRIEPPFGTGHQLAAFVLLRNVERLSRILVTLSEEDKTARIRPELLDEIERLPRKTRRFVELLKDITTLPTSSNGATAASFRFNPEREVCGGSAWRFT